MENLGPINIEFLLNNAEVSKMSNRVKDDLKGITRTATDEANKAEQIYKKLGMAIGGYFSFAFAKNFVGEMAKVRGEFQQLDISLQTIIGNKEEADRVLARSVELAAKTPFALTDVGQATKQLLAYGESTDTVTDTLRRLGDVSAGLSIPLNDLTYLYGTTRVQGRLFAKDLQQFTGRGIPLTKELAKQFNVAESEVMSLVSAGKVGFPQVQKALENLTSEGGIFFNLMEKQSASITGLISNLGDAFDRMYNQLGQSNEGIIQDSLRGLIALVDNYQKVIDILKVLAVTYGSYRAAVILTNVSTKAMAASNAGLTASQILQEKWTVLATRAQRILNATMLANPYVATAAALGAIISALIIFGNKTKDAQVVSEEFKNSLKSEQDQIKSLFDEIKKTNEGTNERAEAIKKVNSIYGQYLPNQLNEKSNLQEIEKAQRDLNIAIAESIFLRSQELDGARIQESTDKYAQNFTNSIKKVVSDAQLSGQISGALTAEFEKAIDKFSNLPNASLDSFKDSFNEIFRQFNLDVSVFGAGGSVSAFNYEDLIQASAKYARALNRERNQLNELTEAKRAYLKQLGLIKDDTEENTEAVEKEIMTLKKLKEQLSELQSARDNLDITDRAALDENARETIALQKQIADLEIKTSKEAGKSAIELLKERLATQRKAYEDYYNYIELFGQESADKQFEALKKQGKDYVEYLQKVQAGLDPASRNFGLENLAVQQEMNKAMGLLTPVEQLRKEVEEKKGSYKELADYIQYLNERMTQYSETSFLPSEKESLKFLAEERAAAEKQEAERRAEALQRALEDNATYNDKVLAEEKRFQKELELLTEAGEDARIVIARQKHAERINELKDQNVRTQAVFKDLFGSLERMTTASVKQVMDDAKLLLETQDMSEELRLEILKKIAETEKLLDQRFADKMKILSTALNELSGSFRALGEATGNAALANAGSAMAEVAQGVEALSGVFADTASSGDVITIAVKQIARLFTMLADAAKQRREAEAEYLRNLISYQREYNLSIAEQIRLQSQLGESVFLKDYEGRVRDAMSSLSFASQQYQEALKALGDQGQSVSGQRNTVNPNNILVGALTGGIVGAAAGLFGGKQREDTFTSVLKQYPELIKESEDGMLSLNRSLAENLLANGQLNEQTAEILQNIIEWEDAMAAAKQQIKDVIGELSGSLAGDLRNALVDAFKKGEDAALAMGQTVEKVLENILSQLIFNRIFANAFAQLEEDMAASYGEDGDGDWLDDFARFFEQASGLSDQFNEAMSAAQQAASGFGFNLFNDSDMAKQRGLQGAIRREMTEATASELTGLFRGQYDITKRHFQLHEQHFDLEKKNHDMVAEIMQYSALIEAHTAETVAQLHLAVKELKDIAKNTKGGQTGRDLGLS